MYSRIYTDGACRGNPGDSAWAYVRFDSFDAFSRVMQDSGYIGVATNNEAEYWGIINALRSLAEHDPRKNVALYSDSQVAIRQITGESVCTCRTHLRLRELIADLVQQIGHERVRFCHVRRTEPGVQIADRLCNQTLDRVLTGTPWQ